MTVANARDEPVYKEKGFAGTYNLGEFGDEAALTAAVCGDKTHRGRNAEEKREKGAAVLRLL